VDTILIFRIGSLGDTVVALPCFHRVAASFPNLRRILVTDSPAQQKAASVESVLDGSGLVHDVIYFPPPPRKLQDFIKLRRKIRATKATKLIYIADRRLSETLRDLIFFYACGVRRIVGAPLERDLRTLRLDDNGHTEHEAERLARCLAPLGPINLNDPGMWNFRLQLSEKQLADRIIAPFHGRAFASLCLGGKVKEKDWGDENWAMLLALLRVHHPELRLAFVGAADEFERCSRLASACGGCSLNLCGALAPRETAAVIENSAIYIGHDCGPMHLAAAVGVPCVAIFGPVNMPKWWHPMGSKHRVLHDMHDVRNVTPCDVLEKVDEVLAIDIPARAGERLEAVR